MFRTRNLNLISTAFALAFVLAAGVSVNAQKLNTTKSNTKDHRVAPPSESGGAKGWDGKVQGNANRFDPIVLVLKKDSGEKVLTRQIADLDNDGKISEAESAFDFGVLLAGDYVMTLRSVDGKLDDVLNLIRRVTVTGPVGGTIEKDWKLETGKAADASRENQSLGGLGSHVNGLRIPFKADGKMSIAGKITLPTGKVIVKDIKHK